MDDDIRIKDLQSTASYMESDDYLPIDGLALGNRKIPFTGLMDSEDDRLPTTDKTPRGAITEHEGDISEIKQSLSVLIGQLQQPVTNLNDPLLNGCAYITFNTYPASASNKPTGNTGIIMTYGNGRFRQQVAFELAGEIYTRYSDNGSITAWTKRG